MCTSQRVAVLVAFSVVSCFAQDPARVGPDRRAADGRIHLPPPPLNPGNEIYNTLYITDDQAYVSGNSDAWSGLGVFGAIYDLQVVDDVAFDDDCCLDVVIRDQLTFLGGTPAGGCYVALYADDGDCSPSENPACEQDGASTTGQAFTDTIYGLLGMRLSAATDGSCCVPAGNWFVECQPHDETDTGDWYYTPNEYDSLGCNMHFRDGGRGNPGYGSFTWTANFDLHTVSQAVSVKCDSPTPRCMYQVSRTRRRSSICGAACDVCSYRPGDLLCIKKCPDGENDCSQEPMKFKAACGNGSTCVVVALPIGCEVPPGDCRFCR